MNKFALFIVVVSTSLLVSCFTHLNNYREFDSYGTGYSNSRIDQHRNLHRVRYVLVNDREQSYYGALYRSGELARELGYDYVRIIRMELNTSTGEKRISRTILEVELLESPDSPTIGADYLSIDETSIFRHGDAFKLQLISYVIHEQRGGRFNATGLNITVAANHLINYCKPLVRFGEGYHNETL